MSLAENLLNSLPTENISEDYSTNEEEHIVIDNTRKITVPAKLKTIAVTGDKDVETVMIDCVRYWDNHDLSEFAIFLNYMLPNGETGTYVPYGVSRTDEYFTLEWIIGSEFTKYSGALQFLITARKVNENNLLVYQWSSLLNSDMTIQLGLEPSEMSKEEELESDVVTQILQSLNTKLSYSNIAHSTGNSDDLIMSQRATTEELNRRADAIIGTKSGTMVSMDDVAQSGDVLVNPRSKNLLQTINGTYDNDSLNHYKMTVENGHYEVETKRQETYADMREFWTQMGTITLTEGTYRLSRYNNTFDDSYGQNIVFLINVETGQAVGKELGRYDTSATITVTEPVTVAVTMYTHTGKVVITYPYTYSFDLMLTKGTEEEEDFIPSVPKGTVVPVKSCGKNLIAPNDLYYAGRSVTRAGVTFTVNDDLSIHVKGSSTSIGDSWFTFTNFDIQAIDCSTGTYTVSQKIDGIVTNTDGHLTVEGKFINSDKTEINNCDIRYFAIGSQNKVVTIDQPLRFQGSIYVAPGIEVDCTVYLQLEKGTVATPWEPYIEGETIEVTMGSENINVLSPIAPNMSITTDNDGVVVDVEYNRDSNIVIEKLTQAIISLGGNI